MKLLSKLHNLDNISDGNIRKLDNKVDKINGKGLSANDYTTNDKNKLANIQNGAEVNVQSDWNALSGSARILNKPDFGRIEYENSGYHNCIYRGNDVTSYYNDGTLFTRISSGKFTDLYIGDYFKLPNKITVGGKQIDPKWYIIGFDTFLYRGDTPLTKHHAIIFCEKFLGTSIVGRGGFLNQIDGFVNTDVYNTLFPSILQNILEPVFGTHIIEYRARLTNSSSLTNINRYGDPGITGQGTGITNGTNWYSTKLNLFNESQLGAAPMFSSSANDYPADVFQFPYFKYGIKIMWTTWLRDETSQTQYLTIGANGVRKGEKTTESANVRPYFLID